MLNGEKPTAYLSSVNFCCKDGFLSKTSSPSFGSIFIVGHRLSFSFLSFGLLTWFWLAIGPAKATQNDFVLTLLQISKVITILFCRLVHIWTSVVPRWLRPPRKPTFKASMTGRFASHQTILDRKKSVYGFCSKNWHFWHNFFLLNR